MDARIGPQQQAVLDDVQEYAELGRSCPFLHRDSAWVAAAQRLADRGLLEMDGGWAVRLSSTQQPPRERPA